MFILNSMTSPFLKETFVDMMEELFKLNNNNIISVVNKMGEMDKEKEKVLYYTYDCLLCYNVWKELKSDDDYKEEILKLEERVNSNLDIIKT